MSYTTPTYAHWPQTIPDATESSDGVMTAAQVRALRQSLGVQDIRLFVDNTPGGPGRDSNPGTQAAPLLTLDKACSLVPANWLGQCKIFLQGNTGVEYSLNQLPAGHASGPLATPLAIVGGYTSLVGPFAESVGDPTGKLVTFVGPALTPAIYENAYITCLTGANAGVRCSIRDYTANTVTPTGKFFFGAIAIGDLFVIEQESVVVRTSSAFFTLPGIAYGFVGINIKGPMNAANTLMCFQGVTYDGENNNSFITVAYSQLYAGSPTEFFYWFIDGIDNPFTDFGKFAALNIINCPFLYTDASFLGGVYSFNNVSFSIINEIAPAQNFKSLNSFLYFEAGFFLVRRITGNGSLIKDTTVQLDQEAGADFARVTVSNSAGNGVDLFNGSHLVLTNNVDGSSSGTGVNVFQTGTVIFDPAGNITITGTGGDAQVGATNFPGGSWSGAPLNTTGFTEVNGGGPTLNRITPFGV